MLHSKLVSAVALCLRTVIRVSLDLACAPVLAVRSHSALVAENLFVRKTTGAVSGVEDQAPPR